MPEIVTTPAMQLIAAERSRQILQEGFTLQHDLSENGPCDLITAALEYASHALQMGVDAGYTEAEYRSRSVPVDWPWHARSWKPTTPERDLVKATALLAAALDVLLARRADHTADGPTEMVAGDQPHG